MRTLFVALRFSISLWFAGLLAAQTPAATVVGRIMDTTRASIADRRGDTPAYASPTLPSNARKRGAKREHWGTLSLRDEAGYSQFVVLRPTRPAEAHGSGATSASPRRVRAARGGGGSGVTLVSGDVLLAHTPDIYATLGIEIASGPVFSGFAVLGFKKSTWLAAAGIAGHGFFDFFIHHAIVTNPGMPVGGRASAAR